MWNKIKGKSIIGPSHERYGQPNQDSFSFRLIDNNNVVLVATDGAGSQENSREGADLVADTISEKVAADVMTYMSGVDGDSVSITEQSSQDILEGALLHARSVLEEHENYETMGCTVAAILANSEHWVAAVVGDGIVVVRDREGTLHTLTEDKQDGVPSNYTVFVNSKDELEYKLARGTAPVSIAVATDGMAHASITNFEEAHPGFWNRVFSMSQKGQLDIGSLFEFMREHNKISDDTTLVATSLVDEDEAQNQEVQAVYVTDQEKTEDVSFDGSDSVSEEASEAVEEFRHFAIEEGFKEPHVVYGDDEIVLDWVDVQSGSVVAVGVSPDASSFIVTRTGTVEGVSNVSDQRVVDIEDAKEVLVNYLRGDETVEHYTSDEPLNGEYENVDDSVDDGSPVEDSYAEESGAQ